MKAADRFKLDLLVNPVEIALCLLRWGKRDGSSCVGFHDGRHRCDRKAEHKGAHRCGGCGQWRPRLPSDSGESHDS